MRKVIPFVWAMVATLPFAWLAQAAEERLAYDIVVTAPGTKSQGWHGTLYDEKGNPLKVKVGETRTLPPIGTLVGVACSQPWVPCGMVPRPRLSNVPMREQWIYKLYTTNIGSRCPSWRGELLRNGDLIPPPMGAAVETPWGPFIAASEPHGWAHKSWNPQIVRCP